MSGALKHIAKARGLPAAWPAQIVGAFSMLTCADHYHLSATSGQLLTLHRTGVSALAVTESSYDRRWPLISAVCGRSRHDGSAAHDVFDADAHLAIMRIPYR